MILRGDMDNSSLIARNAAPNRWLPHSVLPAQVVLDEHQRREQPRVLELHRAELGGDRDPAAPAHLRGEGPHPGPHELLQPVHWFLVSEPGLVTVLANVLGNLILLPEMKPRNNLVY